MSDQLATSYNVIIKDAGQDEPEEKTQGLRSGCFRVLSPWSQDLSPTPHVDVCSATRKLTYPRCPEFLLGFGDVGVID